MSSSFDDVASLAAFLELDSPFDLNAMRAALKTLVRRAVTADAKIDALRSEVDTLRAQVASGG